MIDTAANDNDALDALAACPCCLLGPQQRCLKTSYTHLNNTEIYWDMLKECFNIRLDVPSDKCGICEECVARLRDASHFKRQVQRSQRELQERLAGALKIIEEEPPAVVKSEITDEDGTSDNLLGEEHPDETDGAGGAGGADALLQGKEEMEYLKHETEWEESASLGVQGMSETAALHGLYAGHVVTQELVLGPEGLDMAFRIRAAQMLDVDQPMPRDCKVRLEHIEDVKEPLSADASPVTDRGGGSHRDDIDKEEPPAVVKSEITDEDGTRDNLLGEEHPDETDGAGGAGGADALLHIKVKAELGNKEPECVKEEPEYLKEEPQWERNGTSGASNAAPRAGLQANVEVKDEDTAGKCPLAPRTPESSVQVKEEMEYLKHETEWEESASLGLQGMSETAALHGLYAGHVVTQELVLGPEGLDMAFRIRAAQMLDVDQPMPRDCKVRLERIEDVKEPLSADASPVTDRGGGSHRDDIDKEEPPAVVKSEITDEDGTSDNLLGEEHPDETDGAGGAGGADALLHIKVKAELGNKEPECVKEEPEYLKEEPQWERNGTSGASNAAPRAGLQANVEVKDEDTAGKCPLAPRTPESSVQVKEEMEYLKHETEWEESASLGVQGMSETAALHGLYAGHVVTQELVLGPEGLDMAFRIRAAQMLDVDQPMPRDCKVRLERIEDVKEPLSADASPVTDRGGGSHRDDIDSNLKNEETDTAGEQNPSVSRHVYSVTNADSGEIPVVKHIKKTIITKETILHKCSHCSYASSRKSNFLIHERKHTGEKPYKCSHCSFASAQKCDLIVHERKHTGEKPYKCSHCSFASAQKCNLIVHERKHTGEKPYKCNHCSYASARKSHILDHERIHNHDKPYKCRHCRFASAHKSNIIVHERKHTGEKPYKCDHCSFASVQKCDLVVHERKHTGEKPYKCNHCSYATSRKNDLLVHERKHTGEKPYKCHHCSYATIRKHDRLVHEKIHSGEKPFKCRYCSYATIRKNYLLVHERRHTGQKT